MSSQPAHNAKPAELRATIVSPVKRQSAAVVKPVAPQKPTPPAPATSPPAPDWNAFLAERALAVQKAKSARRRRFAMFVVTTLLVLAAGPVIEYMNERYPQVTLSAAFDGSKAYIKDIPRRFIGMFSKDKDELFIDDETAAALGGMSNVNPSFGVASLYSSAAILANLDTGSVLLKKNADIRAYPASLTKILTVLIAIERRDSLPESLVIEPDLLQPLYDADSTMAGFLPNEEVRTDDLIYGALLLSGGECSVTLARALAGSEENFAAVMNERARELGMLDTHFTNSTGLHDDEHYSTVRDMAKLLLHALDNEEFEEMFTTVEYKGSPSNLREEGMLMINNIFARIRTAEFDGGRILGGKTGWTGDAGQCLASLAEKDGNRYIFVSTGNGVEPNGISYNFEDALNAYDNGILRH